MLFRVPRFLLLCLMLLLSALAQVATDSVEVPFVDIPFDVNNIPEPIPPPKEVRNFFELDPFYQQWIDVDGIPVLASTRVNPYALKEAAWLIWQVIGHRPSVLQAMVENKVRFPVLSHNEILTQIPEYSDSGPDFLLYRIRGLGGSGLSGHPAVGSSEENLLHYPGGVGSYTVLIHELGHAIHLFGLNTIDPAFDNRLKIVYDAAMANGLWQDTYASSDRREYWAEGTQAWFNSEDIPDYNSSHLNKRTAVKNKDPDLAALLTEVYGDNEWRYTPPTTRVHLQHLQGFSPQDSPTFQGFPELEEVYQQFLDPDSDGGDEWVDLRPYDPNLLPSLLNESRTAGPSTMIGFVNRSQADVLVYWVEWDGTENFWTRSPPNRWSDRHHGCKANDIWLIKDPNGRDLAVFQAMEKTGRALISASPTLITPGVSKYAGDNQSGVSGTVLRSPFVVEVRDKNGSALEGISITFAVVAGDGTLSITDTTTDENGRAESSFTLGFDLGTNTIEVSAVGIENTVTFNAVSEPAINIPFNVS